LLSQYKDIYNLFMFDKYREKYKKVNVTYEARKDIRYMIL